MLTKEKTVMPTVPAVRLKHLCTCVHVYWKNDCTGRERKRRQGGVDGHHCRHHGSNSRNI